jgi:hypothetical protein
MTTVRVTPAEAELLAVARALVTPDAGASIEGTLGDPILVTKIGPTAMAVLKSTLARGTVKMLARLGGSRPRVRPNTGNTRATRVFEVRPSPNLAFSKYTFELVRWLTATPLHVREAGKFDAVPATLGDELCAYLALRLVSGGRFERVVASAPGLRTRLSWLGFSRSLARFGAETSPPSLEGILATEDRRTVVECLAGDLAQRWTATSAWDPDDVIDPELAVRIGTVERGVLKAFVDEIEKQGRWDLATFLIEAGTRALPRGMTARDLAARVAPRVRAEGTLRSRTESRRRAGALFQALARLGKKRDALALVRFIDDDYDAAQAVLTSWEILDRDGFVRAEGVLSSLDALEELKPVAEAE